MGSEAMILILGMRIKPSIQEVTDARKENLLYQKNCIIPTDVFIDTVIGYDVHVVSYETDEERAELERDELFNFDGLEEDDDILI